MSQAKVGNRHLQARSQLCSPLWVLTTLHKPGLLPKFSSFVLFLKPLARTWVSPKPRQDDPLFGLAGKRHSTGGHQSQGSPCCVRVSGRLMNPDRTATQAECLENCIWVIGLDSGTEFSPLEGVYEENALSLKIFNDAQTQELTLYVVDSLT